jgi:type IV secretion system protein VirB3
MSDTGKLQADPLFVGLTRPTMFLGVSFLFVVANFFVNVIIFIQTSNFIYLFVCLPGIHMIGYIICFKEPLFLELFFVRSSKCNKCRNKIFHGANSYDVY